ncbi:MAG TPA: hydroxysqualene dehydroxylase HpnE [Phycisphaeraceae bacterium]
MSTGPTSSSAQGDPVVVVGGGLAGIAAAIRLAQHRIPVTLIETRKRLGGRATSFVDPATGDVLDNCQHVLIRCCTNLLALYRQLGVIDRITWHRAVYFADRQGRVDRLEAEDLPAPLHLLRPLLRFQTLTWREKLAIGRGMLAILQVSRLTRQTLYSISFAQWLGRNRQPAGAIEKYWSPIVTSACNETIDRIAAGYAIQVFQEGFLAHEAAYEVGIPRVPLVELYEAACRKLHAVGGQVLLSTSAQRFLMDGGRVVALELADGQTITSEAFISTVPFDRLLKLAPPELLEADPRLPGLERIEVSPIIGIHLFFELPDGQSVMDLPHVALMESPLHWVFNKGVRAPGNCSAEVSPEPPDPQRPVHHLHGVISAAHELVDWPADRLIALATEEVRRVLPKARDARLAHARVVKEKRATFSALPGVHPLRPGARSSATNLYLAGDWTDTGWPATMEGATRSGYLAAAAVLRDRGIDPGPPLIPDLPPTWLYRALSG